MYPDGYEPRVITIPNPGAGNNATFSVPGSESMILSSVAFLLTTSAVAGTRTPVVEISDGAGIDIVAAAAGFGAAASTTAQYAYSYGLAEWDAAQPAAATNFASGPVPLVPLAVGDTITIRVTAIDAGDTLTNVRLVVLQRAVRADAEAH